MHDGFLADWNDAIKSGDTSSIERMTEDYYAAIFSGPKDKPVMFSKQESIDGMKQSVRHFLGCEKRFDNRAIRLRNQDNAVVFYEQLVTKNDEVLARLFTIENWQLIDGIG
jgi:predicted DNA binding protein